MAFMGKQLTIFADLREFPYQFIQPLWSARFAILSQFWVISH